MLAPEIHSALALLLRGLTTPDNTVRSQAEDQLNNDWLQNRPDVLLMGLAEQIQGAEETGVSVIAIKFWLDLRTNPLYLGGYRRDLLPRSSFGAWPPRP